MSCPCWLESLKAIDIGCKTVTVERKYTAVNTKHKNPAICKDSVRQWGAVGYSGRH